MRSVVVILGLFLLAPTRVEAQVVRGRVLDPLTEGGVRAAAVAVLGESYVVGSALTDDRGSFEISLPESGTYVLRVSRQGYRAGFVDSLVVNAGETVSLPDIVLELSPVVLEEVRVAPERVGRIPGRERIRRRQLLGQGTFLAGAIVARDNPSSLAQYLGERTGLWVRYAGLEPYLWSPDGPYHCLLVQVNHWPLDRSGYRSLDEIRLDWIAAIEIYNTIREVPREAPLLGAVDSDRCPCGRCGLVNIWLWNSW